MLRKNTCYEGKRTKNLLKVKKFLDAEYVVENVEFNTHRFIRKGKEVSLTALSNVWIRHEGYEVAVGSGWTQEQRLYYKDHPEELIGKTITVKYFEETTNKDGKKSLRFPVVKCIYDTQNRTI